MFFLIDTSNLLYRGFYSFPNHPFGEIFYSLTTIRSLLKDKSSIVYFCLDGTPKGKSIDPSYKSNRDHGEISVYRYLPQLIYLLRELNRVKVAYNPELEADEVIFSLTRLLEGNKVIISTDNDLLQSLNPTTEIQRKDKIITVESYLKDMEDKFHSVQPERLPIYRAIVGDSSDNLKPPSPRFPKELAARIAMEYPYSGQLPTKVGLESLFSSFTGLTSSKKNHLNSLLENYSKFSSNFRIMKLEVHEDLEYDFLGDNPIIPNFPQSIMAIYKTIKILDSSGG